MACDSQIIRGRNLPAVAYVSEKREFNFSCMEKRRFSGQSADLRDDWNGYVSDDVLPCHSGVKSGNCDSSSVFCTNLNYGVLCISGKRFPKKEEVLVLATVIVGIFLLATHGSIKNLVITNAALFWGLLSAFAFAVYNVQPKKLLDEFGTLETTGWGMFVGGVLVTPFTKVWSVPGHWDIMTVAMTIGVVFLGTIVAFSCYLHGISMLGPVQGSMLGCVEPLVATILSATVLGQAFGMIDVVGILCIVGAVTALTVLDA